MQFLALLGYVTLLVPANPAINEQILDNITTEFLMRPYQIP
jgi:hypothetical protein